MIRKLASCILLSAIAAVAQNAPAVPAVPQYDLVSTVKPNHSGDSQLRIRMDTDAIYIQDATLKDLLSNTYGLRQTLIFNLPKWSETDHFDIQAKVLSEDANFLQHMTRLQRRQIFERLLTERFGVVSHTETRTLPDYELVQVGQGPQLVENPPPPPSAQPEPIKPGRNGRGNTSVTAIGLDATGVRIADLCANLAHILDRSVIDKTGLPSFYDITLTWSSEHADEAGDAAQDTGPSLFTALQEQLGLKLIPAKGPVQVLVVDKALQPKQPD
jgi:uncharacterized protein (TIGR03435 family)